MGMARFLDRKTVLVMVFIAPIAIFVVSVLFSIGIQSSEIKTDNVMMRLNFLIHRHQQLAIIAQLKELTSLN